MQPVDQLPSEESLPRWRSIRLIYCREMRDQLRDRRTLFTIAVLPIALYPLLGMLLMQVAQFGRESEPRLVLVGAENLPPELALLEQGKLDDKWKAEVGPVIVESAAPVVNDEKLDDVLARWIREGMCDAAIVIPPNLNDGNNDQSIRILYSVTNDRSMVARDRGDRLLTRFRTEYVKTKLAQEGINPTVLQPFKIEDSNVAPPSASQAAFWSKLLPFVMMVWALTGAFYPAIDLVAGEKERGTLETLLCSPAMRSEIVWGKLLAVATFSMITALLNVAGLELTMGFVSRQLPIGPMGAAGMPPIATLGWLLLALVPLSGLFSALALSVAAMARSSKEAQYYLMPLLMILMPLVVLPLLRGIELNFGTAVIPITGLFLLVRALVEQQYIHALWHLPIVAAVTAGCCLLAMRWARHQFESEQVLFRSDDQWDLSAWMRRMIRDREAVPTAAQSFGLGILVLMLLFFGRLSMTSVPATWGQVVVTVIAPQLGLVLFPALLMATVLTKSLRVSLRVQPSPWLAFPAAVLMALLMNPAYIALTQLVSKLYPISGSATAALQGFDQLLQIPAFWQLAVVLAIIPAVCEEICFRGFGMSGLLRTGRPYVAVTVTAIFFGMSHGILQQSISATVMGLVLGIIAWRTGSVIPSILFHATHNALSLWLGRLSWNTQAIDGVWDWILVSQHGEVNYHPMWTIVSSALALVIFLYFLTMPRRSSNRAVANISVLNPGNASASSSL